MTATHKATADGLPMLKPLEECTPDACNVSGCQANGEIIDASLAIYITEVVYCWPHWSDRCSAMIQKEEIR